MGSSNLHLLQEQGQSVWLDSLSREMLVTGELARHMEENAVTGVTSNPTIFQKALATGDWYDDQLREIGDRYDDPLLIFRDLAIKDIQDACDLMRPVWEQRQGTDGYVSLEVDPRLAYDTDTTRERAILLHEKVDRPNLFVKIPATEAGLPAIEDSTAAGKAINITLIFSLDRHAQVMEAYIRGLERFVESGGDPGTVFSVASFFVSRVDTEADKRLEAIGTEEALALRGKLGIANARLAYQAYLETFSGERWDALAAKGARKQRCLWASTSTKNPEYRDVLYVEELIGPETVNTMPIETIEAFQDHGFISETLTKDVDKARELLDELRSVGVHYDDVVRVLEEEGVQKFTESFMDLLEGIERKRELVTA